MSAGVRERTAGPVVTAPRREVRQDARPADRPAARLARQALHTVGPGAAVLGCVLGLWQLIVDAGHVNALELPAPSAIFAQLHAFPGVYARAAWVTVQAAAEGFALALAVSLVMAAVISQSRIADRVLSPVVTVLQVTPVIVLAVPLEVWLGFGRWPQVIESALITFVPIARTAVAGFSSVDRDAMELFDSVDATRWQVFWRLRLPNSTSYLLAGAKVAVGLALVGAVIAEYIQSDSGLGYLIANAYGNQQPATLWGAVYVLMALGLLAVGAIGAIGTWLLRWQP